MLLIRDWYREAVTKQGSADSETPVGMHRDLLLRFVRIEALLILPVAPHASEHIWSDLLGEKQSIQLARFPEPSKAVDAALTDAELYIKELVKGVRDAELGQQKKKAKGKGSATFDPNLPKSVSVFVAKSYPEWQTKAIELVKASFDPATNQTDRTKLKAKTIEAGLMKDKRIMPFCVNLQVGFVCSTLERNLMRTPGSD
jgi:leucyl-tRNA synthetase